MLIRPLLPLLVFTTAFGCSSSNSSGSGYTPTTDTSDLCTTPLAPNEPLCSTAFGDTIWAGSHRASYAQGSSPLPGPVDGETTKSAHLVLPGAGVPVIASFSAPYDDGGRVAWSTVTGLDAAIVKVDHETFEIIDWYVPREREDDPPTFTLGLSGAYTAVDAQNRFIAGRTRFVSFFGDSVEGDRSSPIELKKRIFMPDEVFCNEDDVIAGMSLTYDGHLAFATEFGNLFVISPDADPDDIGDVPVVSTNENCATVDEADLEIVSNSVAVDENGGIYLLTSAAMYRFDWDGSTLTQAWRTAYESAEEAPSPIRLGPGSGSTPSLMGTNADDDRFVVITDGQALMNLVLFWRDAVPDDWEPIAPGKDPRIACEIPVDFGTGATVAISEQSVAVRGYAAVVVNDLLTDPTINPPTMLALGAIAQNLVSALEGGIPEKAPFGLERIDWDPETRTCSTTWANSEISVPNGIPSISQASGLVYGAGQRPWGLHRYCGGPSGRVRRPRAGARLLRELRLCGDHRWTGRHGLSGHAERHDSLRVGGGRSASRELAGRGRHRPGTGLARTLRIRRTKQHQRTRLPAPCAGAAGRYAGGRPRRGARRHRDASSHCDGVTRCRGRSSRCGRAARCPCTGRPRRAESALGGALS